MEGPGGLEGEPREALGGWARAPEGGRSLKGGGDCSLPGGQGPLLSEGGGRACIARCRAMSIHGRAAWDYIPNPPRRSPFLGGLRGWGGLAVFACTLPCGGGGGRRWELRPAWPKIPGGVPWARGIYIYIYIHIYIYIYIAESPPANPRFFLEGAHEPRGRHRVYTARPDGAPTGNPPPPHGRVHSITASPPRPASAPPKKGTPARRVGDIVPCRAAMNRHGPTPGDTRPPPPLLKRAPRRPPGREQPPSPFKERPPSGALAQPPGPLGVRLGPAKPFHAPPSPAAAHGPARSPLRRSTTTRDPGPGAPVPSPARPPGIHPAGPVPVRFGREGTAWRFPPPPPGFAPVDDARRDSSPPSGVRAPPLIAPPRLRERPGLPGRLWPAPTAPLPRSAAW